MDRTGRGWDEIERERTGIGHGEDRERTWGDEDTMAPRSDLSAAGFRLVRVLYTR